MAGGLLPHTHNFWQPTFNINFHWRVGEFRHYVVAKSVFMMLQKSFISLLIECLPVWVVRILASKCIQYTDKKCLLRHPHICVMCKKENSVNFEFHATFPWLTIDYFESSNGFWHKCVNVSKKRIFRHLVIFVDQLWKFRFWNVFFIVEAPKE